MIHKINNNKVYISVDTMGAELRSLCDVHGLEYLWQGGEKWNQQSPVIFPIVGKPKDFKYIYGGKEYEIANHGFAMTKEFKVAQKRSDKLVLRLREDEETYKSYPFMFTLDMCFELHDDSLTVRFVVTNNDEKDMPYSLGGHPGFRVPLESDEKFEGISIRLIVEKILLQIYPNYTSEQIKKNILNKEMIYTIINLVSERNECTN